MIERMKYFEIILIIFLTINIRRIYCIGFITPIAHPIQITFDFSNFLKNDNTKILIKLLKRVKRIISRLVSCNNNRKLTIDSKLISKCYTKMTFISTYNLTTDLVIFPMFNYRQKNNFEVHICRESEFKRLKPVIAILFIKKFNIKKIINNIYSKHIFLMEMLRAFIDCLGLTRHFMANNHQPKNNFHEIPEYLLSNSLSFKSYNKLYNLLGLQFQVKRVNTYAKFYIPYWNEDSIVKDIRSSKIELDNDISEVSMNLLNDVDFYITSQCDFFYLSKNRCYRVDQKCLSLNEFSFVYLNYAINFEKQDEIVCYLSDTFNLKSKQCGIQYGYLLEESIDFCPLIKKYRPKRPIYNNTYDIPELQYYRNQTLNLLVPSKKCKRPTPRTIYFISDQRKEKPKNIIIKKITLSEKQRKFFVTYSIGTEFYFNYHLDLLNNNGLIRSFDLKDKHNIMFKYFSTDFSLWKKPPKININKYQKIVQIFGKEQYYLKDKLYKNYLIMKNIFPKDYNYMPLTYIYPADKKIIEKKFKKYKLNLNDLWIVKPNNLYSGLGIHLFNSLKEEASDNYLISKYLKNPHLIEGRKYDFRFYVLVTGFKPLRIYLNKEGLVRIATNNYTLNKKNIKDSFIHLTNTGLNVRNKKYRYPKNFTDDTANKWSLATYRKYMKKQKININKIFGKIKDIIIKTIISGQTPIINLESKMKVDDRSMFNVFGFDIIIDDKLNPSLLEVNSRPTLHIYDNMDKIIKTNIIVDTLNIVGIVPFSHELKYRSFDLDSFYKKGEDDRVNNALCELTRPRGDFELIFPLKNNINKYRKFFLNEKENSENKMFWEQIMKPKKK